MTAAAWIYPRPSCHVPREVNAMIAWKQRVGKFNLAAWMCRTAGFVWSLAAGALRGW